MKNKINKKGFSLAEILMSLGILSIGMLLIAAVFPAGIHFTTIATERTIASSVADEAFAKIRMYCTDPCSPFPFDPAFVGTELEPFPNNLINFNIDESSYPSDDRIEVNRRMYSWSALWRRLSADPTEKSIQITVFVNRRGAAGTRYYEESPTLTENGLWPVPLAVTVNKVVNSLNQISITGLPPNSPKKNFINLGCTILDGQGRIYRVIEGGADVITLESNWPELQATGTVWVVPASVGGGRYPCIAIYQKVVRF